jgi:hypothetical protein
MNSTIKQIITPDALIDSGVKFWTEMLEHTKLQPETVAPLIELVVNWTKTTYAMGYADGNRTAPDGSQGFVIDQWSPHSAPQVPDLSRNKAEELLKASLAATFNKTTDD